MVSLHNKAYFQKQPNAPGGMTRGTPALRRYRSRQDGTDYGSFRMRQAVWAKARCFWPRGDRMFMPGSGCIASKALRRPHGVDESARTGICGRLLRNRRSTRGLICRARGGSSRASKSPGYGRPLGRRTGAGDVWRESAAQRLIRPATTTRGPTATEAQSPLKPMAPMMPRPSGDRRVAPWSAPPGLSWAC